MQTFVKLADELAPWVNRETIIARAPEPRLSGRLFDFNSVVSKFLGSKAEEFYDQVKPTWEWNSRYWEQVALMNLGRYLTLSNSKDKMDHLEDALTHARHAVAVEHHPFPLTTLGKVLLNHMVAPGMSMKESFNEAFDRLSEAIAIEERRNRVAAQPYGVIFSGVLTYLNAGGELDHKQLIHLNEILAKASTKLSSDREMQQQVIVVKQRLN